MFFKFLWLFLIIYLFLLRVLHSKMLTRARDNKMKKYLAISNGNRTEWSPIWSVIILVITKTDDRAAWYDLNYQHYGYCERDCSQFGCCTTWVNKRSPKVARLLKKGYFSNDVSTEDLRLHLGADLCCKKFWYIQKSKSI